MSSSDPVYEQILKLGPFFQGMVSAALDRANLVTPKSLYFCQEGTNEDRQLLCDFREKQNLADADELMMPMVRGIVSDAKRLEMTAIVRLYSKPQLQYALQFGVAAKSFLEITEHVFAPTQADPVKIIPFARKL